MSTVGIDIQTKRTPSNEEPESVNVDELHADTPPQVTILSSSLPVVSSSSTLASVSPRTIMSSSVQEYDSMSRMRANSTPRIVTAQDDEQIKQIANQRRMQRSRERQIGRAPRLPPSVTMSSISPIFPDELKNLRVKAGHADMQGRRPTMEDATTVNLHFREHQQDHEVFLGVYDGHGGVEAASFVGKELHQIFLAKLQAYEQILEKKRRIESGEETLDEEDMKEFSVTCSRLITHLNRLLKTTPSHSKFDDDSEDDDDDDSEGATKDDEQFKTDEDINIEEDLSPINEKEEEEDGDANDSSICSISIESLCEEQVILLLLREAFLETNDRVCHEEKIKNGTTASVAYIRPVPDSDTLQLFVANVGDSRVVLSRDGKACRLTVDHRPTDADEQRRVKDAGGYIINQRVNAILAVTRAIGDVYLQPMVTSDPHTDTTILSPENGDEFIIVACDGVWDVVSDQDAVDLIKDELDPRVASVKLRDHAYSVGSTDNISVAVLRILRKSDSSSPSSPSENPNHGD